MAKIRVRPPQGPATEHTVTSEVVIGRSGGADLAVPDPLLSRRHARIFERDGGLAVEDMGSRNGTFLNGSRLEGASECRPGDRISLGGTIVEICGNQSTTSISLSADRDELAAAGTILRRAEEFLAVVEPPKVGTDIRRQADHLRILNEAHRDLAKVQTRDELIDRIFERIESTLHPEQMALFLRTAAGDYQAARVHSSAPEAGEVVLSRKLITEVADKRLAALVIDAQTDSRFSESESLLIAGVRSILAAPLLDGDDSLGMIALFSKAGHRVFREEDLEILVPMASIAALKIRNAALVEEAAARKRLEAELALARRIQLALLPATLPSAAGWALATSNVPSRGVSGDYFNVIPRRDGSELVLVVADVSGKGIGAALLTATLDALVEPPAEDGSPTDVVCDKLGRGIFRRTPPEKYATAFLGALDVVTGRLTYTNAGHNPPLVLRAGGGVERLPACGPPLGLFADASYTAGQTALGVGDQLVIYTDGITEAENAAEEQFGLPRLEQVAAAHAGQPANQLAAAIDDALEQFVGGTPYGDDRTMLIVRRES